LPVLLDGLLHGLRPSRCALTPQQGYWASAHREAVTSGDEMLVGAAEEVSAGAGRSLVLPHLQGGPAVADRQGGASGSRPTRQCRLRRPARSQCLAKQPRRLDGGLWPLLGELGSQRAPDAARLSTTALSEVVSPRRRLGQWQRESGSVGRLRCGDCTVGLPAATCRSSCRNLRTSYRQTSPDPSRNRRRQRLALSLARW
jgi:hypothetical protein